MKDKGEGVAHLRILKGTLPVAVSLGLIFAVTAILWQLKLAGGGSALVYIYLFPVALIAALYSGRLAISCTVIVLICADYFLQEPIYSLTNDNPLEYGDLVCFAVLATTAIKFIRVLVQPRTRTVQTASRYRWS